MPFPNLKKETDEAFADLKPGYVFAEMATFWLNIIEVSKKGIITLERSPRTSEFYFYDSAELLRNKFTYSGNPELGYYLNLYFKENDKLDEYKGWLKNETPINYRMELIKEVKKKMDKVDTELDEIVHPNKDEIIEKVIKALERKQNLLDIKLSLLNHDLNLLPKEL